MTIQLPPRRALPPEIKERMRPEFTTPQQRFRQRFRHREWAGAAAAALIVVGSVFLGSSAHQDQSADPPGPAAQPGLGELVRCWTAFDDRSWHARLMLELKTRKVLLGEDGRLCELTRTRATTFELGYATTVRTPSGLVVGRPLVPASSMTALVEDPTAPAANSSGTTVITPDLFLVDIDTTKPATASLILEFDGHGSRTQLGHIPLVGQPQDSYQQWKGRSDQVLARCLDNAVPKRAATGFENDWRPGAFVTDLLLAHNSRGEWGVCRTPGGVAESLDGTVAVPAHDAGPAYLHREWDAKNGKLTVAGLVGPDVERISLTSTTSAAHTNSADIRDGSFAVQLELAPAAVAPAVTITLMTKNFQPIYSGTVPPP